MKERYSEPTLEVIEVGCEDVVKTSGDDPDNPWNPGGNQR